MAILVLLAGCGTAAAVRPGTPSPHSVGLSQSAHATASASPRPSLPHPSSSSPTDQGPADAAAGVIDRGFHSAPDYGGDWLVGAQLRVAVVGQPSPSLQRAITQQRAKVTITIVIVHVAHSYASLFALTQRIGADEPALQRAGIDLSTWGPDAISSTVTIGLRHYSTAKAARLRASYGASWVTVTPHSVDAVAS